MRSPPTARSRSLPHDPELSALEDDYQQQKVDRELHLTTARAVAEARRAGREVLPSVGAQLGDYLGEGLVLARLAWAFGEPAERVVDYARTALRASEVGAQLGCVFEPHAYAQALFAAWWVSGREGLASLAALPEDRFMAADGLVVGLLPVLLEALRARCRGDAVRFEGAVHRALAALEDERRSPSAHPDAASLGPLVEALAAIVLRDAEALARACRQREEFFRAAGAQDRAHPYFLLDVELLGVCRIAREAGLQPPETAYAPTELLV